MYYVIVNKIKLAFTTSAPISEEQLPFHFIIILVALLLLLLLISVAAIIVAIIVVAVFLTSLIMEFNY